MPKTSLTPLATSVSTNASDGVIFCLPVTARFFWSVMVFIGSSFQRGNETPRVTLCALLFPRPRGALAHHLRRIDVRIAERFGDGLARHLAECDVEPVLQVRIVGERLLPALVRDRQHERQRR